MNTEKIVLKANKHVQKLEKKHLLGWNDVCILKLSAAK